MSSEYAVIYEHGPTSWVAWLPGPARLRRVAKTRGEVEKLIAEAIVLHGQSMREHGEPMACGLRV